MSDLFFKFDLTNPASENSETKATEPVSSMINNLIEKVSLGIRLEFQSFEKTLINQEIENEMQNVKNLLSTTFVAELK